jgi:hypothetical protein
VASIYRQLIGEGIQLDTLKPDEHLAWSSMIESAMEAGEEVHREIQGTLRYLKASLPVEAKSVPIGF